MAHGVERVPGLVRLQQRMRSGTIDAGVRPTATNEDPRPKQYPPTEIVQHMAEIDRPSEQWFEEQPKTVGSLKKPHQSDGGS